MSANVPLWQALPDFKITFKDGDTTFIFSGSYDGNQAFTEKMAELIDGLQIV